MIEGKKLRRVSDLIFQEAMPPEDGSRPLEWRRRFNHIRLPLRNIKVVTKCSVHDIDFDLEQEKASEPLKLVKADVSEQIAIKGMVNQYEIPSSLFFAVKDKDQKDLFSIDTASGSIYVSIKNGLPSKESDRAPAGLYGGLAFRLRLERDEDGRDADDIHFDLTAPKELLQTLASTLRADPHSTVEVGIYILSYTDEPEGIFGPPIEPLNILLEDDPLIHCFLSWASITTKIGQHYHVPFSKYSSKEYKVDGLSQEGETQEEIANQDLLQVLLTSSKRLNSLVAAIWVLIIVIVLSTIFG